MDILAHGLWAGAAAKIANRKLKKSIHVRWAVFWGIFPDLSAFFISFFWGGWALISGKYLLANFLYRPGLHSSWYADNSFVFNVTHGIYDLSHSLLIFALVFLVVWVLRKHPVWELGGWLLHIAIDVPTHNAAFFPTPVFWPLSSWKVNGIGWAQPWFLILNYSAIAAVYLISSLAVKKKK